MSQSLVAYENNSLRDAFGRSLVSAADDVDFFVFDADVAGGTGVHYFRERHPARFIQCGIAEQNMISAAAGFASTGRIPVASTFAVFALRALEQIRLSVCYSNLNVKIVVSHIGLDVGPDGASAQCLEDIAAFNAMPNLTILSPADPIEMGYAVRAMLLHDGPVYLRTGRSPCPTIYENIPNFSIGKAETLREGNDVSIMATGVMVARAIKAAEDLKINYGVMAEVINLSTIKPLDHETIIQSARKTGCVVTAEDHSIIGGLGSSVASLLVRNYPVPVEMVGVNDQFGASGDPEQLTGIYGIDHRSIVSAVMCAVKRKGEQ